MEHDSSERHRCLRFLPTDSQRVERVNPRQRSPGAFKNQFGRIYVSHDCPERQWELEEERSLRSEPGSLVWWLSRFVWLSVSELVYVACRWCMARKWMEMCVTGSLCLSSLRAILQVEWNSHSRSTTSAISISIPNSRQLPIVYLFLQLVVDFLSGSVVEVPRRPLRSSSSTNSSIAALSWSRAGARKLLDPNGPKPSRNFPRPLWQAALHLRRLLISLMTIDDRTRLWKWKTKWNWISTTSRDKCPLSQRLIHQTLCARSWPYGKPKIITLSESWKCWQV